MSDQLDLLPLAESRADIRLKIAKLWLREIEHQPASLRADDGTKVLALSELTLRLIEESGYTRGVAS